MKRSTKVSLIAATVLIVLGLGIIAAAFSAAGWELRKFSSSRYITTEQLITEDFSKINIDIDTTDIIFFPSEDDNCRIVGYEDEKNTHSFSVKDDTLWVKIQDMRKWYDHIGINTDSPEIEIYLPKEKYESLYLRGSTGDVNIPGNFSFDEIDVKLSTGDIGCFASANGAISLTTGTGGINIKNISAGDLVLSVTTGKVNCDNINCSGEFSLRVTTGDAKLSRIKCGSFTSTGNTGDLQMDNLIASDIINIERSTGDLNFTSCDGGEIYILTDTGHVKGSFASEKIFFAESDTGDIDVPKSTSGGICEIKTDTGDIEISIE